jgi:hypothetical protein
MENIQEISDSDASYYTFTSELVIGDETKELSLSADVIPSGLYLKVIPASGTIY